MADLSKLWVVLDLFEKDLSSVHKGQKVLLRTEVYPGKTFPARVAYLGQVIDEKTRTAAVRIEFENQDGLFRPGQFVTATLVGDPTRGDRRDAGGHSAPGNGRSAVAHAPGPQGRRLGT